MTGNNAAYLHEGGTTPAMSSYEFYTGRALAERSDKVFIIRDGWKYLIGTERLKEGVHYLDFSKVTVDPRKRENHMGTSRVQPVATPKHPGRNYIENVIKDLKSLGVNKLVTKGGDDERWVDACLTEPLLKEGIHLFPQPKTIDLDLFTGTKFNDVTVSDTPGARSAISNIDSDINLQNLKYEAQDTGRVFVIEIMGRNRGKLGLAGAYKLRADFCIIPEVPMTKEREKRFMEKIEKGNVVVVSEGTTWWNEVEKKCTEFYLYRTDESGKSEPILDEHGRKKLGGAGEGVAAKIEKATGIETRTQHTDYMPRSGNPHEGDVKYEEALARELLRLIDEGKTGVMPAPARVVPYNSMSKNMHHVPLPPANLGYEVFKSKVIQEFNVSKFYDEKEFTWTKEFERLIDTMLQP
jgi:6-phosphofructokinase